ncbi:MAG: RsiV family protein [Lachnospiraceae bacterium]|nr:RsiV family protein [Lachnospiraceae bacterium]
MNDPNRPDRWRIDMNEQEQLKQLKEEYENMTIPEAGRERLQAGIDRARIEKKRAERVRRRSAWIAAAAAVIMLIALPNTNMQIAHAMENIPVLGGFFRLVTVRQYNYSDENHDAEVELAQISYGEDTGEGAPVGEVAVGAAAPEGTVVGSVEGAGQEDAEAKLSEDGVKEINQDMEATVEELIRQFEDTLSEEGYHGLHVTQEVVTDNALYYTVKLSVLETEASGYEHNQFYTIAKQTGNVVTLEDLFAEGSDYISAISENIKTQMKEQMAADEGVIYFLDNDDMPEFNFQGITEQTNFYFNERGELVIAFDEYEVAPGSMGAPEFVIPQEVTAALLK